MRGLQGGTWQTIEHSWAYQLDDADFDGDGYVSLRLTASSNEYDNYYLPADFEIHTATGQELLQGQLMPSNWESPPEGIIVTVVNDGTGNKYVIDGIQQDALDLKEGETYVFDWSRCERSSA